MATEVTLYMKCSQCGGTGQFTPSTGPGSQGPITCTWPGCDGSGYLALGKIVLDPDLTDVMNIGADILAKCNQILDEMPGGGH